MGVVTSAEGQVPARVRGRIASSVRWNALAARWVDHPSSGGVATGSAFAVLGVATLAALGLAAAGIDSVVPAEARNAELSPVAAAVEAVPAPVLPSAPAAAATYLTLSGTSGRESLAFSLGRAPSLDGPVFSLSRTPREQGLLFVLPETPNQARRIFPVRESPPQVGLTLALPKEPPQDDRPAAVLSRVVAPVPVPPVEEPKAAWRETRTLPDRPVAVVARPAPAVATPPAREAELAEPVLNPDAAARIGPADTPPPVVYKPRVTASAASASADDRPERRMPATIAAVAARFDLAGYDLAAVRSATSPVPRVYLETLPPDLSDLEPVAAKKRLFVKAVLPIVLRVNEEITAARWRAARLGDKIMWADGVTPADRQWLIEMAEHYGTAPFDIPSLLPRMDIVPTSLALAQAAEESGWGTSRFVQEGNALFGQYTYKSVTGGMLPQRRDEDRRHRVRRHDTLLAAVRSYVHNLNTHVAYEDFRQRRARLRSAGRAISGYDLAGQLQGYSERRGAYVETIRRIIRQNRLGDFDRAWLNNRQWTAVIGLPGGRPI